MARPKKKPEYDSDQIMQIMATLIKSADDVWVRRENEDGRDLVAMEFVFNLAMRVEKGV